MSTSILERLHIIGFSTSDAAEQLKWLVALAVVLPLACLIKSHVFWRPRLRYPLFGNPHTRSQEQNVLKGVEKVQSSLVFRISLVFS